MARLKDILETGQAIWWLISTFVLLTIGLVTFIIKDLDNKSVILELQAQNKEIEKESREVQRQMFLLQGWKDGVDDIINVMLTNSPLELKNRIEGLERYHIVFQPQPVLVEIEETASALPSLDSLASIE